MYFPEHGPFEFKNQAPVARLNVRENQDRSTHFKYENGKSKGRVLVLTGEGPVFDELSSRSDVYSKPIPLFLHLNDLIHVLVLLRGASWKPHHLNKDERAHWPWRRNL